MFELEPTNCKYDIPSCLYRGTQICDGCVDASKYEWDYTKKD